MRSGEKGMWGQGPALYKHNYFKKRRRKKEYYCLSSCWICSQSDDPLTNGIVSQITPPSPLSSREWIRRLKTAPANGTFLSTTWKIRRRNLRSGGGDGVGGGLAWLFETKEYSFLMISPKLYDISPFFLLILSPHWITDLLIPIKLLDDGYSLFSVGIILKLQ